MDTSRRRCTNVYSSEHIYAKSLEICTYRKISNISGTLVGNKIVFILDLTSGFKGFGKDSRNTARESFKHWDLVRLILETWR